MKFTISGYYIEINDFCNAKCFYCYNNSGYKKRNHIEKSLIEKIISEDENISEKEIIISGGEPFLNRDIIDIISFIDSKHIRFKVITNGTCLKQDILNLLVQKNFTLQFSLNSFNSMVHDSITGITGSYTTICNSIEYIKTNMPDIKIEIRYLLHRGNINELDQISNSILYQKSDKFILDILKFSGRDTNENYKIFNSWEVFEIYHQINELKNKIDKISIPKITSICKFCEESEDIHVYPRIDCFGYVYPCNLFCGDKYQIGNVFKNSIRQMLNSDEMKNFLDMCFYRKDKIRACQNCFAKEVCYGGCPGLADMTGNFYNEDVFCELRKEYFINKLIMY